MLVDCSSDAMDGAQASMDANGIAWEIMEPQSDLTGLGERNYCMEADFEVQRDLCQGMSWVAESLLGASDTIGPLMYHWCSVREGAAVARCNVEASREACGINPAVRLLTVWAKVKTGADPRTRVVYLTNMCKDLRRTSRLSCRVDPCCSGRT